MRHVRYYLPGIFLILVAILVVAMPEILVAFVASMIVIAGITALYIGHNIRKSETEFRGSDADFSDDDSFGRGFTRSPIFRGFYRRHWH